MNGVLMGVLTSTSYFIRYIMDCYDGVEQGYDDEE